MPFLNLTNVTKSYDGVKQIIQPLNVAIQEGEFIVIVGPSGCGKSTLLRMVAGLEKTTSGQIWIDQRDVTEEEPKDRQIAMVFQNYALYPHMSVFDNIAYGLKIRGESKDAIRQKVDEVAKILSLDALLDRKPKELSGGQRQRVAMGRAIVRKPAVFLFDEPLSNLDAKLRVQMRLELKSLQARLGVTSLYVTHDQVEAMTLADRVIIMNQGVAEQIGTPEDLYHNPRTTFVASFIGSPAMNLLNGELSASGDRFVFSDKTEVSMGFSKPAFARQSLILGVRPEHLQISETNPSGEEIAPDHIALQSKVTLVEHLGADNLVYTEFAGQTLLVRAAHHVKPAIGSLLNLTVPKANLYYFDAQTGKRVD